MFDICKTAIQVPVQRRQFIDPAVQSLVGLPEHLAQEKRGEGHVHHDTL